MNIINTIKKYFSNNAEKINFSKTSTDNVILKNQMLALDTKIQNIETYIEVLKNYNTIQQFEVEPTSDFYTDALRLIIIGNFCIISGMLYTKHAVTGNKLVTLPLKIFSTPNQGIRQWYPLMIDGVVYNVHADLTNQIASRDTLSLYFYEEIPADKIIPINLVIPINPNYTSHTEP